MMKKIHNKIWVKIIALLVIGVFSFNQPAYARHYSPDKNIEQFFKSDLDQGLTYLAGTALSIAVPCALPSFGVAPNLIAQSVVVGGAMNIAGQGAVAAGAVDPKVAAIAGGVAGGLASGGINLAQSGGGFWTVIIPTATWSASSVASAYAGEKNPILGMAAGTAAGLVTNVAVQSLAHSSTGNYRSADGKLITKEEAKTLEVRSEAIDNIDAIIAETNGPKGIGVAEELTLAQQAAGLEVKIRELPQTLRTQVEMGDNIITTKGDLWRALDNRPIVEHGFFGGVKEAFRTISPGQWTSLLVSAGVYEALRGGKRGGNKMLLASTASTFAGNMLGSAVNQSDSIGIAWAGGIKRDDGQSIWNNPNYNFSEALLRNAIYMGMDYGLGRIDIGKNLGPAGNTLVNGAAKYAAASVISAGLNKTFLTDTELRENINKLNPNDVQYESAEFSDLLEYNLWQGAGSAAFTALPIAGSGAGINSGYEAVMYAQYMTRKFATGADYATMYTYNFGSGMDNFAAANIASSASDSIFNRGDKFYGKIKFSDKLQNENRVNLNAGLRSAERAGEKQLPVFVRLLAALGRNRQINSGRTVEARVVTLNSEEPIYRRVEQQVISDALGNTYVLNFPHRFATVGAPQEKLEEAKLKIEAKFGNPEKLDIGRGFDADADKIFVTQKKTFLHTITPLDYSGRAIFSVAYDADSEGIFNQVQTDAKYLGNQPQQEAADFTDEELFKPDSFAGKVVSAFSDGSIAGGIRALSRTKYYYGAGGRVNLARTTQILQTPNVKKGEEFMFYSYADARRDRYLRAVDIEGGSQGIRQDIPGINPSEAELRNKVEQDMKKSGWVAPALRDNPAADSREVLTIARQQREEEIGARVRSYMAYKNLDKFNSLETGTFVYNDRNQKVAILPEITAKAARRIEDKERPWATEVSAFKYSGLGLDKGVLKFTEKFSRELDREHKMGTFIDNKQDKYQLLLRGKEAYSAGYVYSGLLHSNAGLAPVNISGLAVRGVSVESTKDGYGRGIADYVTSDMVRQAMFGAQAQEEFGVKEPTIDPGIRGIHN